jgi:hypothetical protein
MQFHQLKRREFITLVGGAVASPVMAWAAPSDLRTIGLLAPGTPSSHGAWFAELVHRLHALGWIEGRNLAIESRYGEVALSGMVRSQQSSCGSRSMSSSQRRLPSLQSSKRHQSYQLCLHYRGTRCALG